MCWCFAKINNRLAEIFFEKEDPDSINIFGHVYVDREEYTTKREQKWIAKDTKRLDLSYYRGFYNSKQANFNLKIYTAHIKDLVR